MNATSISLGSVATPPPSDTHPPAPSDVSVDELVLDPALQCRASVLDEVVEEYAQRMQEGARFPPIRAVRVDERLLVVDGWHRLLAARRARTTTISCVVVDGTRRFALLEAVRANATHGLQRSRDDKRRAVVTLLQDAEWCRLSGRELAELASVSHTHVDQVRKAYGVRRGEVLTDAQRELVDGEPSVAWRELLAAVPTMDVGHIEAMRVAKTPLELCQAVAAARARWVTERVRMAAFERRQDELATSDRWPWPADATAEAVAERCRTLDGIEDLEAAALVRGDHLRAVYEVLEPALRIAKLDTWTVKQLVDAWKARPALLAQLEERLAEEARAAAARPKSEWELRRAIQSESDPGAQARAVMSAPIAIIAGLSFDELHPSVREGVLRDRLAPEHEACGIAGCGGWVITHPKVDPYLKKCTYCRRKRPLWLEDCQRSAAQLAPILRHEGFALDVDGIRIDARAVRVLELLQRGAAPAEVDEAVVRWRSAEGNVVIPLRLEDEDEDEDE